MGARTDLPYTLMKQHDIVAKVNSKMSDINARLQQEPVLFEDDIMSRLDSCLYLLINGDINTPAFKDYTVTRLLLELMIIQNRLLVAESIYYGMLNNE